MATLAALAGMFAALAVWASQDESQARSQGGPASASQSGDLR